MHIQRAALQCFAFFCLVAGLTPVVEAQTLEAALSEAIEKNPQLEAQRQLNLIAGEQVEAARAERRPDVTVSGSYGYQSIDTNRPMFPGQQFVGDQAVASAQLQAEMPIYTGGRISAGIRQAKAGRGAADAQYRAAYQGLTLQVITAYLDVLTARETVAIRENSVSLLEEQSRASQDRFDAGVVTRTDIAQSDARLQGGLAALAGARAGLEAAHSVFAFLIGDVPGDLAPPPPPPAVPDTFEQALATALADNPEIEAQTFAERGASEAVGVAAGVLKPSVSIVGTASVQETFTDNFQDTSVSALARASVPLFEKGVAKSQVRQARLQRQRSRLELENTRRRIRAELAQAWYSRLAAEQAIVASRQQVSAAEIAYEGVKEELSVGSRTTLDVLDQEQQLLDARLGLVEAERDFYVATARLLNAMGRLDLQAGTESTD